MNTLNLLKKLYAELENRRIRARLISVRHLADLEQEIKSKKASGLLDEIFYRKWLSQFKFIVPETLPEAKSILITATPQPQQRVMLIWQRKTHSFVIPPTYAYHTDGQVQTVLEKVLGSSGFRIEKVVLPVKLLAVRSGLSRYGRNNISYIEDLGSFYRLKAYFTDLPCEEDSWFEPVVMEACMHCKICEKNCPTGAISSDRFMIRAEKCLTYLNEGEEAFPEWANSAWHHCLVGCMRCQWACPQNKKFKDWIEDHSRFDESETELLLQGVSKTALAMETVEKLEKVGLLDYLEILPRNLGVLLS